MNYKRILTQIFLAILLLFLVFPFESYGKIKLPAEVTLELADPAIPETPIILVITAISKVPFHSGKIILSIPTIENKPPKDILLWSGSANEVFKNTLEYIIPVLPIGQYQFRVTFECTPQRKGSQIMKVGKNLYIDVQANVILSSNVSFTQIKRIELKNELERRGLSNLPETQQKTLAPDLMRQLEELNKLETVPEAIGNDTIFKKMPGLQGAPVQGTKEEVPGTTGINLREKELPSQSMKAPMEGTKNEVTIDPQTENFKSSSHIPSREKDYLKSKEGQEKMEDIRQ